MNKELDFEDLPTSQKKILNASLRLFAKNGFHATTTAQIASNAGVSEGTIYKYFQSKEQILNMLISEGVTELCKGFFIDFSQFNNLDELVNYIIKDRLHFASNHYDLIVLLTNQFLLRSGKLSIEDNAKMNTTIVGIAIQRFKDSFDEINSSLTASQIIRIFAGPLGSYTVQRELFGVQPEQDMDIKILHQQIISGLTLK